MGSALRSGLLVACAALFPLPASAATSDCETLACLKYKALLGDPEAPLRLANAVHKTDRPQGIYWYRIAAENGSAVGQHNYGVRLVEDSKNVADCARALFWFKKAAAGGSQFSKDYIAPLQEGISKKSFRNGCFGVIGAAGGSTAVAPG